MSAAMHSYFYEDEVFRVNSRGQVTFGLVLDNCDGSSSSASGSEAEQPLQRGDLRIVWHPSGLERIVTDRAVGLADRALMPGDVVRRMIKGKDTQRGYCRDISVTGAVQVVGTNLVLPSVPSERLHPLEEYTIDLAVCLDSWVGTSKTVNTKLTLVSGDGSKFEVPDAGMCLLEDCMQRRRRGARGSRGYENASVNEYYPGQTVIGPMGVLEGVTWLNITKEMETARRHKMREHKFTVESVETESVGVHWQCRALGEQIDGGPPKQPPYLVEGEDLKRLKLLNLFEPCTLQVGAKNFLILTEEDTFSTKMQWRKSQNKLYRNLRRQTRSERTKMKETESNPQQPPESNVTNSSHTFRIPGKPKKRSVYNREGKFTYFYNNLQLQPNIDSKANYLSSQKDSSVNSKEEPNAQSKMDVDIVIVDGNKETQVDAVKSTDDPKIECLDSNVSKDSEVVDTKIIDMHHSDKCSHLDVPDKACNGKCTSSDRSCSPDIDMSNRQKKLRKTKLSGSTNNSRSNSPAVYNGDHKYCEQPLHGNLDDSDSWGNTSSDEASDSDSCGTWSSQCSSSSMASGRGKKSPHLVTKFLKGKRLKRTARRDKSAPPPKPGDKVVVETLCTKSKANVVWQDGTIELDIPSTDLYPIHHLDGQECFPGDFVISETPSETSSHRDYGVVQKVDHYGRTAIVKWFRTYTSCQEPIPQYISESEVSVYDVKDHPDFQYRPGTVVIRVANFTGTEAKCTAGQVMDNFPTGRVHVWWVDGHKSMCWPQDLYKVGEYDSDEGDIWGDDGSSSEDSWETQSSAGESDKDFKPKKEGDKEDPPESDFILPSIETEALNIKNSKELPKVPRGLEPRAAAHIERGLNAMARMEEILSQNPSLQSHEIMRKLLTLYKDCRFLDRLMGTSFFHEDHFQGLIERVRERGGSRDSVSGSAGVRRVHYQVMRLFSRDDLDNPESATKTSNPPADLLKDGTSTECSESSTANDCTALPQVEIVNLSSSEPQCENSSSDQSKSGESSSKQPDESIPSASGTDGNYNLKGPVAEARMLTPSSDGSLSKFNTPAGSIGDLTNPGQHSTDRNRNEDSGIDSQSVSVSQGCSSTAVAVSTSNDCKNSNLEKNTSCKKTPEGQSKANTSNAATTSSEVPLSNRNVCLKLCSLITIQMMKACAEVSRRRNSLFVPFLNRLMKEKETTGAPLPYRFSVQFDELVVTMTDDKDNETGETVIDKPPEETASEAEVECSKEESKPKEKEEEDSAPAASGDSSVSNEFGEGYTIVESAPTTHRFRLSLLQPSEPRAYHQAIAREIRLLKSLPHGVWVRGYEDRMDLLSIMIAGPAKTPYEDGLFLFDVQLGGEYPRAPPLCHYLSFCSDRLNPNLYEDGKVCVSLLGTWSGRGVEVWGRDSSLLQVIVSLQGLILCAEPYFNEAGFDKQKGSQQGNENSRMYNEMVLLKLVQSLTKMVLHPPEIFKNEIRVYQGHHASGLCDRLTRWMLMSEEHNKKHPESPLTPDTLLTSTSKYDFQPPEYPLIPASKGFCLTLRSSLDAYRNALSKAGISFEKKL